MSRGLKSKDGAFSRARIDKSGEAPGSSFFTHDSNMMLCLVALALALHSVIFAGQSSVSALDEASN